MSKSTKIIAALGVVAGLGVAALPAFSYATQTPQSVDGNVELYVEVQPAISMTISGNNDDGDYYTITSYEYTIVTPQAGDNPHTEGWYEKGSGNTYTVTEDTTVTEGKTYFERVANTTGVDVFAPTSAGAGIVDGHTEAFKVGPSSSYATLLPNSLLNGSAGNGFRSTITVYTNNATGYTLSVKDADSTTALTQIVSEGTPDTIPALASISAGANAGWNFDVIRHGATSGEPAAFVPTEDGNTEELTAQVITTGGAQIDNWTGKTSSGRDTIVDYNVATRSDQSAGVYTDTIIYTATTN